jgi:hypothetical protein
MAMEYKGYILSTSRSHQPHQTRANPSFNNVKRQRVQFPFPWIGCQSIARLTPSRLLVPIYTPNSEP